MKNIQLLFVALTVSCVAIAQQESQFASTFNNPYVVNAAAGGMSDVIQVDAVSRMQWVGYGQGPTTIQLSGHSQLKIGSSSTNKEFNVKGEPFVAAPTASTGSVKHIIGGRIMSDAIGVFSKTSIQGSYAIHLPLTKTINFGVGIGVGWSNFRINDARVSLYDENDVTYASVLGSSSQQNIGDVNAGLVFYSEKLFVGISTAQIFKSKATFNDTETNSFYNRHYYLNTKYGVEVEDITVEPNVFVRMAENSPTSMDFGARFLYNNATWIGVWGRTSNSLVFQVGSTLVKNLYLSYSYEHAIGKIRNAASGTHEIQLGIYIGDNRKYKKEIEQAKGE